MPGRSAQRLHGNILDHRTDIYPVNYLLNKCGLSLNLESAGNPIAFIGGNIPRGEPLFQNLLNVSLVVASELLQLLDQDLVRCLARVFGKSILITDLLHVQLAIHEDQHGGKFVRRRSVQQRVELVGGPGLASRAGGGKQRQKQDGNEKSSSQTGRRFPERFHYT